MLDGGAFKVFYRATTDWAFNIHVVVSALTLLRILQGAEQKC